MFSEVNVNRTCKQANIPDNHCLCMEPVRYSKFLSNKTFIGTLKSTLINEILKNFQQSMKPKCSEYVSNRLKMINITEWTTSQLIQHGIRTPYDEEMKELKNFLKGDLEFLEIEYTIGDNFSALARIQLNKITGVLTIPLRPLVTKHDCMQENDFAELCTCFAHFVKEN